MPDDIQRVLIMVTYTDQGHPVFGQLYRDLKAQPGLHVYHDLQVFGPSLEALLSAAIMGNADYVLHLHSGARDEMNLSYAMASSQNSQMKLIAVLIGGAAPAFLREVGYVDLATDYQQGLDTLLKIIRPSSEHQLIQFDISQDLHGPSLIVVSDQINRQLMQYFRENPDALRTLKPRLFEELVATLFAGFGYEVELTQKTHDGGKDVIAIKKNEVAVKYLIECKRPGPGKCVGIGPVRELYAVKCHEGATKGILATTVHFSPDALHFFSQHRWELEPRDVDGLLAWIGLYLEKQRSIE